MYNCSARKRKTEWAEAIFESFPKHEQQKSNIEIAL